MTTTYPVFARVEGVEATLFIEVTGKGIIVEQSLVGADRAIVRIPNQDSMLVRGTAEHIASVMADPFGDGIFSDKSYRTLRPFADDDDTSYRTLRIPRDHEWIVIADGMVCWSNIQGWVNAVDLATHFTEEETDSVNLPDGKGVRWIRADDEIAFRQYGTDRPITITPTPVCEACGRRGDLDSDGYCDECNEKGRSPNRPVSDPDGVEQISPTGLYWDEEGLIYCHSCLKKHRAALNSTTPWADAGWSAVEFHEAEEVAEVGLCECKSCGRQPRKADEPS